MSTHNLRMALSFSYIYLMDRRSFTLATYIDAAQLMSLISQLCVRNYSLPPQICQGKEALYVRRARFPIYKVAKATC